MAEGLDSIAVSASEGNFSEFSNTTTLTDSLSFTGNANYVKIKDEQGISDEQNLVGVSQPQQFQVQDNTHVPKFTNFLTEEPTKEEETMKNLNTEVVDDTAMFISEKSCTVDKRHMGFDGKSTRKNRRRKNAKNELKVKVCGDGCKRKRAGEEKRVYCIHDLENLRFSGIEEQKKKWIEVYCGLDDTVKKEYDCILHSIASQNHAPLDFKHHQKGNNHSEHLDDQEENIDTINYEEESDDSDDDYSSIQRPAFMVTGEPDFDSGPPEDGLEYLRRVRWEASKLPKVKVAKVEGGKLNKEQTCYMPQIPDIASCQEHLLPLKEWEKAFLSDFSELRQALSRLKDSFETCSHQEQPSNHLPQGIVVDKFDDLLSGEDESSLSDAGDDPSIPKLSPAEGSGDSPTLSVILRMDAVARVSMLRKRITVVESMNALSRVDCLWLFSLCAVVDTPLDADTCAALRSLLRKCACLRADKSKLDDEVIMLNMLATISGRYFGQSEL